MTFRISSSSSSSSSSWLSTAVLLLSILSIFITNHGPLKCLARIDTTVQVYDNVLDKSTARELHVACQKWKNDDVAFVFPLQEPERHGVLERVLNDILHQLYPNDGEESFYVEFWKRRRWEHILAHADMDEGWEREQRGLGKDDTEYDLKHPETGHVLYLDIGSEVHGPTVVWNVSDGGEFYKNTNINPVKEMIVVPAVTGRLLRFQGDLLHAVPRPATLYWTLREDDGRKDKDPRYQRSVLLFNTWRIDQGMLVDYQLLNGTDASSSSDNDAKTGPSLTCQDKSKWESVPVLQPEMKHHPSDSTYTTYMKTLTSWFWYLIDAFANDMTHPNNYFQIPLMGNMKRRGGLESMTVTLETKYFESTKSIRQSFNSAHNVTKWYVQPYGSRRKALDNLFTEL